MSITPVTRTFTDRHIGVSDPVDIETMLTRLGYDSLEALVDTAVPAAIRRPDPLQLPPGLSEEEILAHLRELADRNVVKTQNLKIE